MKPNITVSTLDIERLEALLEIHHNQPLHDELNRARVVEPEEMPSNVVTMRSQVRFAIEQPPQQLCLTLAYPKDANAEAHRVSIFSPAGSALLGLSAGQSIDWKASDGKEIRLKVIEVTWQPEANGQFEL